MVRGDRLGMVDTGGVADRVGVVDDAGAVDDAGTVDNAGAGLGNVEAFVERSTGGLFWEVSGFDECNAADGLPPDINGVDSTTSFCAPTLAFVGEPSATGSEGMPDVP